MKNIIITVLVLLPAILGAQTSWEEANTANEKLTGVIYTQDSSKTDKQIYDAISAALPLMQSKRINNKKTNNQQIMNAIAGGNPTVKDGSFAGFATQTEPSMIVFNIQDLHKTTRVYYTVQIQIKDGRYKLTIIPAGTSGSALMSPNIAWDYAYKKSGEPKGIYKKYLISWREIMDQFTRELEDSVNAEEDDW